jgi:V8-like Glu-specific endopeptidase
VYFSRSNFNWQINWTLLFSSSEVGGGMRRQWIVGYVCGLVVGVTGATAQTARFDPADFDRMTIPARQSTGNAAAFIAANRGAFEPISELNPRDPLAVLARPIGRLKLVFRVRGAREEQGFLCTGALVGEGYVLTNQHCVSASGQRELVRARIAMDYLRQSGEGAKEFNLDIKPVEQNEDLDYAILRVVGGPAAIYGSVSLKTAEEQNGQSMLVIHHPGGVPKVMSRFRCFGIPNQPKDIHFRHRCDTQGGSSGSLIFTTSGEVVALHKAGGLSPQDPSSYNVGTRMTALISASATLRELATAAPGSAASDRRNDQTNSRNRNSPPPPPATQRPRRPANPADLDTDEMNDALRN